MKITNRAQKRKAEKLGVLHQVTTIKNVQTGDECTLLIQFDAERMPVVLFIENERVVYTARALDLMEQICVLTNEALIKYKEALGL